MIQEVVVMAADMEKFEKDLLSALHRIVQKSHQSSEYGTTDATWYHLDPMSHDHHMIDRI